MVDSFRASIRREVFHCHGRMTKWIVVQKVPTAFLSKLWPHCLSLQLPFHHVCVNFTVYWFSFLLCDLRITNYPKDCSASIWSCTFARETFWPLYSFCSQPYTLTFCFVMILKYLKVVSSNGCGWVVWRVWMKASVCVCIADPWHCVKNFAQMLLFVTSSKRICTGYCVDFSVILYSLATVSLSFAAISVLQSVDGPTALLEQTVSNFSYVSVLVSPIWKRT